MLLIDLDHTLFRTGTVFWQDFALAFARAAGEPDDMLLDGYEAYTVGEGRLRHTDYQRMLSDYSIANDDVIRELDEISAGKNYLHADALELLDRLTVLKARYDVAVLTFGDPDFQSLKLRLVPELDQIPRYIVQELKADFIAREFYDRVGILIDDKPDQHLPPGWREVHIDRLNPDAPVVPPADGTLRITDLRDL